MWALEFGSVRGYFMRNYHAYPLDDEGKIVARKDFTATNDAEALRVGREHFPTAALEVWSGARVVGGLDRDEELSQRRMFRDAN